MCPVSGCIPSLGRTRIRRCLRVGIKLGAATTFLSQHAAVDLGTLLRCNPGGVFLKSFLSSELRWTRWNRHDDAPFDPVEYCLESGGSSQRAHSFLQSSTNIFKLQLSIVFSPVVPASEASFLFWPLLRTHCQAIFLYQASPVQRLVSSSRGTPACSTIHSKGSSPSKARNYY